MAYTGRSPERLYVQSSASIAAGAVEATDLATLTSDVTFDGGDLIFGDGDKAIFGDGSDLQIYHTGTESRISDQGTGGLKLLAQDFVVKDPTDAETIIYGAVNGAVSLYYDNSKKFATQADGVNITGNINVSANTVTSGTTSMVGITETRTSKTASFTPNLTTEGTLFNVSGTLTVTMPTAVAGKFFTIVDSGSGTLSWSGTIYWASGAAPSPSGVTVYTFVSDGSNWYGNMAGTGYASA